MIEHSQIWPNDINRRQIWRRFISFFSLSSQLLFVGDFLVLSSLQAVRGGGRGEGGLLSAYEDSAELIQSSTEVRLQAANAMPSSMCRLQNSRSSDYGIEEQRHFVSRG